MNLGYENLLEVLKRLGLDEWIIDNVVKLRDRHERDTWQIGVYSDEVNKLKIELDSLSRYAKDLFVFCSAVSCENAADRYRVLDAMLSAHEERLKRIYPEPEKEGDEG